MTEKGSILQHLYPIGYELDYLDKTKYWQTIPNLPNMNIDLVKSSCNSVNINKKYRNRNIKIKPLNFK